jgi:hypothetical protein
VTKRIKIRFDVTKSPKVFQLTRRLSPHSRLYRRILRVFNR